MNIKYAKMNASPGGLTEIKLIVDGDRNTISSLIYDCNTKPHQVEIKPINTKRTLSANAYYWVLLEKLSKKLRISRSELHLHMLSEYGVTDTDEHGKHIIITVRDGITLNLPNFYVVQAGIGWKDGKKFIHYRVLKGSSEMNSTEFSNLLDGLIQECKEQGIETLTPIEIDKLKRDLEKNV